MTQDLIATSSSADSVAIQNGKSGVIKTRTLKFAADYRAAGAERLTHYLGLSAESLNILAEKGRHDFDSAMLAGDGVTTEATDRPAYCVLALDHNDGCPAVARQARPFPGRFQRPRLR
jgi:hypothetical protein